MAVWWVKNQIQGAFRDDQATLRYLFHLVSPCFKVFGTITRVKGVLTHAHVLLLDGSIYLIYYLSKSYTHEVDMGTRTLQKAAMMQSTYLRLSSCGDL